jgi:hypothetical protein
MIDTRSTKAYKLEKENRELKKEIKDLIELCNKYELEHNTTFKLWTMKLEEIPNYEESISLKQRNEKAIEYIKTYKLFNYIYDEEELFEIISDKKAKEDLLEILKGSDKE